MYSDFTFVVTGPNEDRQAVADVLAGAHVDGKLDCRELLEGDGEYDQSQAYADRISIERKDDEVVIAGSMRYAPPLLLAGALTKQHPALVIDLWSTTDHELHEHYRITAGACELVESLAEDLASDKVLRHFLMDGEKSDFCSQEPVGDQH